MARNKKGKPDKTPAWPHELRWHFGSVSRVDAVGEIQPVHGRDIGGDSLQRAFKPDIFQSMTDGARALYVATLEDALHNTAIDCDQILRKKDIAGYDAEPKLFSSDWYMAGGPPQLVDGFLTPTDSNHEIAAPRRYCDHLNPFSAEFYAGETLEGCRKLLWFFKAPLNRSPSSFNDIENLLMAALETGRLIGQAEFRQGFKPDIEKYRNSRKAGADARRTAIASKKASVSDRRDSIRRMLPEIDQTGGELEGRIIERLKEEEEISVGVRTIRRDLVAIRLNTKKI